MVGSRRMAVRPKRNAQKGAADGSRAPRTPQRPTSGRPFASTHRQQDAKRVAEGGRVPAVVRRRMTPRGRSLIPVDEEDESDEDVPADPTQWEVTAQAEPDNRGCASERLETQLSRQHARHRSPARQPVDRLPPWAHVAHASVTPPALMGGTRGSGRSRESGNRPAMSYHQQVVVLIRDARKVAECLTHALAEGVDRRAKGVIGIQSER